MLHGGDAVADQCRLGHQAGAEAALLHALGGTADIEIDLVEAEIGGDARGSARLVRLAAAELKRDRVLGRVISEEPRPVAVQNRAGGDHLGIDQRAAREQAMEEPAMPVVQSIIGAIEKRRSKSSLISGAGRMHIARRA